MKRKIILLLALIVLLFGAVELYRQNAISISDKSITLDSVRHKNIQMTIPVIKTDHPEKDDMLLNEIIEENACDFVRSYADLIEGPLSLECSYECTYHSDNIICFRFSVFVVYGEAIRQIMEAVFGLTLDTDTPRRLSISQIADFDDWGDYIDQSEWEILYGGLKAETEDEVLRQMKEWYSTDSEAQFYDFYLEERGIVLLFSYFAHSMGDHGEVLLKTST